MGSLRSLRKKEIEDPISETEESSPNDLISLILGSGSGPIQEPRLIKSYDEFVEIFGTIHYDGKYKVEEVLEWGNQLTLQRC